MLNRTRCACLFLGAMLALPGAMQAQEVEVTIGDPVPGPGGEREGDCANFLSGWEDGAPISGSLYGAEGTQSVTMSFSGAYEGIGGSYSRTESYPYAVYVMSDGSVRVYNCVTYEELD